MADGARTSRAVEAARARRTARAAADVVRVRWFIDEVCQQVRIPLKARVKLATTYLMNKVVLNLSTPVRKIVTYSMHSKVVGGKAKLVSRVRVDPASRSRPGEFPRADTTQLMRTIFTDYQEPETGAFAGFVGTPLDYGLVLEIRKQRSFLVRTLNEERPNIMKILTGPIR